MKARVLVADDERAVRSALQVNLGKAGYDVHCVASAEEALEALDRQCFDLLLTDVRMPGMSGLDLFALVRRRWPDLRVVVMTGQGAVRDAVRVVQEGAADYLVKPVERDGLLFALERALRERALQRELAQLREEVRQKYGFDRFVGTSAAMQSVYAQVAAVADTSALVLVQGETGTGKELVAHAIHYRSRRARAPFVAVNCGALPENLLESELFGHERGAFTGAVRQHPGKFEQADGGTLFLDEIGELSPAMQVRLLRVLEGGSVTRVGGEHPLRVDVRVVAATNRDLWKEVQAGAFRADLYFRLNVVSIRLPPLRERAEDIPLLVSHFAAQAAERHGRAAPRFAQAALDTLAAHAWPGNVRELEHAVERLVLFGNGGEILHVALPENLPSPAEPATATGLPSLSEIAAAGLPDVLDMLERRILIAALQEAGGVQARAAKRLGISRSNLNYRVQRLGITLVELTYR